MAESEISVINHLIEVERKASLLVTDAQREADRIVADARAKSDADFRAKYEVLAKEQEAAYNSAVENIEIGISNKVESYRSSVQSIEKDYGSFNVLLKSILDKF